MFSPFLNLWNLVDRVLIIGNLHRMHSIIQYRYSAITILMIVLCIFLFSECSNNSSKETAAAGSNYANYAGSEKCISCHKTIYDTHIHTAHFLTSGIASEKNIAGSFDTGKNTFTYGNGDLMRMEKRSSGFFQAAYIGGVERKTERFDMVIGSGTKGQSYASWADNKLIQLPITYFTSAQAWSNSPGYPDKVAFNRPITSRCLECHATFAEKISPLNKEPEEFNPNRMILGVDCEKCHGPALQHVEFQTQHPEEKKGKFIINPAALTRQQSLDMCALCHGGRLQKSKPSFGFTAGDKLSDYFLIDTTKKNVDNIDVHGNQFGLMAASKCFINSTTLTCNTCHNSHENEQGKGAVFSQRCMNCHNTQHGNGVVCKMTSQLGNAITTKCVDCHMPQQPSMAIAVLLQGSNLPTPAFMHTHWVKAYPEETKKVLAYLKKL